jgi:hypothetical protein
MNATLKLFKVIDLKCNISIIEQILNEGAILDRKVYYDTIPLYYTIDKFTDSSIFKLLYDKYNGSIYSEEIEYCINNTKKNKPFEIEYDYKKSNANINEYINYIYNKLIYYCAVKDFKKEINNIREISKIINTTLYIIPNFICN